VSAKSIGKMAFLGVAWPRDAKPTLPARLAAPWAKNWAKTLPREAVWSISGVESESQNGNSGLDPLNRADADLHNLARVVASDELQLRKVASCLEELRQNPQYRTIPEGRQSWQKPLAGLSRRRAGPHRLAGPWRDRRCSRAVLSTGRWDMSVRPHH
jgi:hypothetical protein